MKRIILIRLLAIPTNNGRPIEYYTVRTGDITKTVDAPATSTNIVLPAFPTSQVTFTVTATNNRARVDESTSAPASVSTWVYGRPASPTISDLSATGNSGELLLRWQASPGGAGWNAGELRHEWNNGREWVPLTDNTLRSAQWRNGTSQTVSIRAVGVKNGQTVTSEPVTSNAATPYGPPEAPQISCRGGDKSVHCSWNGGNENGRGGRYLLTGMVEREATSQGEQSYTVDPATTVRACIQFTQNESGRVVENCSEATSDSPQPPPAPEPPGGDGGNHPGLPFFPSLRMQNMTGTVSFSGGIPPGKYKIYCWNTSDPARINWGESPQNPGNFLGLVKEPGSDTPRLFSSDNGRIWNFVCPGNPYDSTMTPGEHFAVELHSVSPRLPHIWILPD